MLKPQKIRIALLGGATGGHIYPLVAVKDALVDWSIQSGFEIELRYFGFPGIFTNYLNGHGLPITAITSSKMRRYASVNNIFDFFKFFIGLLQALWHIFWYMPDVVFSKGGPGVFPIILACAFYRLPIVIHESDAVPGLTNVASARFSKFIDLAFDKSREYFSPYAKILNVVGQPVRKELLKTIDQQQAKLSFGLDPKKPVILITGGSQGAQRLNDLIFENLSEFLNEYQLIHQIGDANFKEYKIEFDFITKEWRPEIKSRYYMIPFLEQTMSDAYDAADLVISRAGAGTIFELAAKGKPAIVIPLPTAANNHQEFNAYAYADTGAAVVLEEENILPHVLLSSIEHILNDEGKIKKMSDAARAFYRVDSAALIANDIIRAVK